jgi:hypothetical protein
MNQGADGSGSRPVIVEVIDQLGSSFFQPRHRSYPGIPEIEIPWSFPVSKSSRE